MDQVKSFAQMSPFVGGALDHPVLRRLEWEHQEMRKMLDQVRKQGRQCLKKQSPEHVQAWLKKVRELGNLLDRHQNKEEKIWTSVLCKYVNLERGPIRVMRFEHEHALLQQGTLERGLEEWLNGKRDPALLEQTWKEAERIARLLIDHMGKEETYGYVPVETMLSDVEKENIHQLLTQMEKAEREERHAGGGKPNESS